MTELSNWNRWGKDDERGTVNLMTDETRKRALATVKEGVTVSLSRDADPVKSADNGNPLGLSMVATAQDPDPFAMETLTITLPRLGLHAHGRAVAHVLQGPHLQRRRQGALISREAGAEPLTRSPPSSAASSAAAC